MSELSDFYCDGMVDQPLTDSLMTGPGWDFLKQGSRHVFQNSTNNNDKKSKIQNEIQIQSITKIKTENITAKMKMLQYLKFKTIAASFLVFNLLHPKLFAHSKQNDGYDLDPDSPLRVGVRKRIPAKYCKLVFNCYYICFIFPNYHTFKHNL